MELSINSKRLGQAVGTLIVVAMLILPANVDLQLKEMSAGNISPDADAGGDKQVDVFKEVIFDGGGSNDPDGGSIVEYKWLFGDGKQGYGMIISHVYSSSGIYKVQLRVKDNEGTYGYDNISVRVNIPPVAIAGIILDGVSVVTEEVIVDVNEDIQFDASNSYDPGSPEGPNYGYIEKYEWIFADGTIGQGLSPIHSYDQEGIRHVILIVTDNSGSKSSDSIQVVVHNDPPISDAGADIITDEDSPVTFDGSGTWDTPLDHPWLTYDWDFGDGGIGNGINPTHIYTHSGLYFVKLMVTDNENSVREDDLTVLVKNVPPIANAGSDLIVNEDDTVTFTGLGTDTASDQPILSYHWDFGDGASGSGETTSHIYTKSGVYIVEITVIDDDGESDSDTMTITVNNVAPVAYAGTDRTVYEDELVFLSGSATDTPSDLPTINYEWDLGDGTYKTSRSVTHTYQHNGMFDVTLTVTDDDGAVGQDNMNVIVSNGQPMVYAGADMVVNEDQEIIFEGRAFDTPSDIQSLGFNWNFGDSTTGSGPNPSHIYPNSGIYLVTLEVLDDDLLLGKDTLTVTVENVNPKVNPIIIIPPFPTILENDILDFSGSGVDTPSDQLILGFSWNFGDGVNAVGATVSHAYMDAGIYTVTLTVTDDDGAADTTNIQVFIHRHSFEVQISEQVDILVGETATYIITIKNTGTLDDCYDIILTTSIDPTWLSFPVSSISVPAGGIGSVFLCVTPPSDFPLDDSIDLDFELLVICGHDSSELSNAPLSATISNSVSVFETYESRLRWAQVEVESLISDPSGGNPTDATLLKALEEISEALFFAPTIESPEFDFVKSFEHVKEGIHNLEMVSSEVPTDYIIDLLLSAVNDRVKDTIIIAEIQAESDNIHVIDAWAIYADAQSRIASGDYENGMEQYKNAHTEAERAEGEWVPREYDAALLQAVSDIDSLLTGPYSKEALAELQQAKDELMLAQDKAGDGLLQDSFVNVKSAVAHLQDAGSYGAPTSDIVIDLTEAIEEAVKMLIIETETHVGMEVNDIKQAWNKFYQGQAFAANGQYLQAIDKYDRAYSHALLAEDWIPIADAGVDQIVNEDDIINIDASNSRDRDGIVLFYEWDFMDGTTDTGVFVSHSYSIAGTYTIILKVTDNEGLIDLDFVLVTVENTAPIIEVGTDRTAYEDEILLFKADYSDTPSDLPDLIFSWDFGDGTFGSGVYTTHSYTDEGIYTVTLTVTDVDGSYTTDTLLVNVINPAPKADADFYKMVNEDEQIIFEGYGYDTPSDMPFLSYYWNFDDGSTASGALVTHTYSYRGIYKVTLTVTDDNGDSGTYTVYVTVLNIAPLANAGWIQSVFEDETVYFIGTGFDTVSDQSSLVYEWDFGDGNTGSGENPTHVYTTSGAYTVCLTVTDDDGDYSKDHDTIKVENIPPTADAGSDISVIEDTTISFSGAGYDTASDISSLTYSWDFGDGSSGSGPSPNHVYSKSGLYIVTLIVTDDDGITSQDTLTVTVNNDAPTADSGLDMTVNEDDMVAFSGIGDDTSTDSAILKYNWEFDDIAEPTSCNGKSAWHRFESLGKYYVTLTVEDDDLATTSDVVEVTVNNVAPTAYAGPDLFIFAGVFPLQFAGVGFDTPSDEPYLTYHWDFGEGSTSDLRNPIHYYTRDGTYTVTLTVTDDDLDYGVDYATIEVLIDSDGDGMPDSWEIQYGLDPYDPTGENGAEGDPDGDDLYNIYEFWADTIPIDEDTDNDSFHDNFWDGVEVFYWIDEGYSLAEAGAKANTWDCDTDGMPDGWEYHYLPELDPDDGTGQYGASGDPDGDSLLNINEYYAGTDPTDEDTDDDYFFDGDEVTCGSNPLDWDSDDDGLLDGDADERDADSDGDGTINSWEPDSDNDYLKDGLERGLSAPQSPYNDPDKDPFISLSGTVSSQFVADGDSGATTTDPTDDDSDDDGIIDGNEDSNRNGVRDGGVIAGTDTVSDYTSGGETDPNNANTDGDYLLDGLEIGLAIPQGLHTDTSVYRADTHTASTTDPLDADTDDDGLDDGEEDANQNGYVNSNEPDPNNPDTDGDGIKDGDNNDLIILTLESIANVDPLSSHTFTLLINDGGSVPGYETSPHIISPASIKNNINEDIAVAFYIFNLPIQVKMDGVVIATLFVTTDGSGTVIEFPNSLLVSFSSRIEKYSFSDPNAVDMDQDADNDGIDDYPEVIYYSGRCRDFRYEDTDGDKNYVFETLIDGTTIYHNIIDPDSDNDEIPDGWEIYYDLDPLNYADAYEDPDYDDLVNKEEYLLGTHPFNWDTDTDYMQDGWEIRYGFKPLDQTDAANDPDKDGLTNLEEFQKVLHPKNSDTDGDGLWDGWHDDNNNGALDTTEVKGEKQHSTNPRKWDTDSDRLCDKDEVDGWYVTVVTSSTTTYHVTSDPLVKDTDGDGLSDFHEEQHSADPQKSDTDSDGLGDNDEVGKYNTDPSKSVTYTRSDTTVASFLDDVQSDAGGEFRDPPCPYAGGAVENVYIEEVKITAPAGANDPFSPTDPGWYEIFTAHVYQENTANTQVSITLKSYNDGNPTSIDNEDIFNNIELKDINGNTIDTNVDSSTDYKGEITVTSTNALAKGDYELFWETDFDDDASGVTSTLYITSNLPIVFVCPDPVLGTFPTEIIFQNTVETKYLYFRGHVHDGGYINNLKLDSTSTISTSTTSGNHLYEDSEFVFFLDPDTDVDLNDEESKVSVGQHTITFDWVVTHNLAEMQFHICTHGWKDPNQHDMDDDLLTDYEEGDVGTNPENPDTDGDAMLDGYEEECGVSNGGWQNPTVHNDRYAVLYVGGVRSGGNHPRYWNQLVDIYDVLLDDYRYTAQNVFVFYADGNTPDNNNCNNPGACNAINTHTTMIDDDATDATITTFLDTTLENTLTDPNDFLYVWFYDHGDDANVPDASVMCWGNGLLDDHEVEDWLADYTCARIAVTMGTCYCGGFIDPGLLSAGSTQAAGDVDANRNINDLAGDVLISMSQDYRVSHSQSTRGFVYHHQVALNPATGDVMLGTATYTNGAFSGVSPDSDGNGFVSLREAYIYAEANDDYTAANHATLDDRPQYWDSHATVGNLGSTTYL